MYHNLQGNKMSQKHLDLPAELAASKEKIELLKNSDNHFKKLFHEHEAITNEIHKLEFGSLVYTDVELETLKKKRLKLMDNLLQIIEAA